MTRTVSFTTFGGVSVLNAIGTWIGGAVGVDLPLTVVAEEATVREAYSDTMGPVPQRIVDSVWRVASRMGAKAGFKARIYSTIPPARGLKSSSAMMAGLLGAVLALNGIRVDTVGLARGAAEASRLAGVSVTGALDDCMASLAPGVHITDNRAGKVLATLPTGPLRAVILSPEESNPIEDVDPSSFSRLAGLYRRAVRMALDGDWLGATMVNGLATLRAAGLERLWSPLREVLALPCTITAGVSGKGPALFAVTTCPGRVSRSWSRYGSIIFTSLRGAGWGGA